MTMALTSSSTRVRSASVMKEALPAELSSGQCHYRAAHDPAQRQTCGVERDRASPAAGREYAETSTGRLATGPPIARDAARDQLVLVCVTTLSDTATVVMPRQIKVSGRRPIRSASGATSV
jgi:hypothetical protein